MIANGNEGLEAHAATASDGARYAID
jgi:hypothetical protein